MIRRAFFAIVLAVPLPLYAQIRASEIGMIAQTIDGTKITMEYSRPRARGRDTLFGTRFVHWGETWTPGANWATTLEVDKPVTLNGHAVPKGKYSVWMIVRKGTEWTTVLDPRAHRYHMNPPDSTASQIRIPVRVEPAPFTDVLTWSIPDLRVNGGTLAMQWERVRIPIDLRVQPSLVMTLSAGEATPYLGRYTWTEQDSTGKPGKVSAFTVTHEDGTLKGQWEPNDPYFKKFALIRIAPDWFVPGVYDKSGQIYEVYKPEMVIEFKRANDNREGRCMSMDADISMWTAGPSGKQ
jgi:hypothetical protein